ncbi:MAG TPA: 8-oxo-dGTP diphosphatase [Anaerolineaceae bacterium]
MNDRTLCFPLTAQRILLGYKKSGFGAGKVNGFGGKVEQGENPREAAARELWEECGIHAALADLNHHGMLAFRFPSRPAWDQDVHVFSVRTWQGEPAESEEMIPAWYDQRAVPYERMWADDIHWLPRLLAGEQFSATFTFAADCEQIAAIEWG